MVYGSVLKVTREDTPENIEKNLIQMKENGFNTVVVWPAIFHWEEKREGYPFNTGKTILKLAEKHNMKIIMELAGQLSIMEYIPDFQMKDAYYPIDENGHRNYAMQSFGYLNYFHPEVDALIQKYLIDVAKAYKEYPALYAYDVYNETLAGSYDEYTMKEFQKWLKAKYGTIDKLNEVWERTYSDFSQVSYSPWKWMSIMPEADFHAFQRTITPLILAKWCKTIRSVDDKHLLFADNVHSMAVEPGAFYRDEFALKKVVDDIGMSFYPKRVTGCFAPAKRWQIFDSYYAASERKGFYIAEMQTHTQSIFNPTTAVRPYELKQWCTEALSAGIKGLIYWMWRPFTKGLQTLGRGLVDYKNRSTERLEFAKEFGKLLEQTGQLMPIKAKVAIVFDSSCDLFQQCYTKAYDVDKKIYHHSVQGAYQAMFDAGVCCDITRLDDIKDYNVLILTNHTVLGKDCAKVLSDFVNEGGVVICDGKFGVVDENSMLHSELPGGDFNAFMGHEFCDVDYEGLDFICDDKKYDGCYGREIVQVTDGECVGKFRDGLPAVVVKRSGKGQVITINTHFWYGYKVNGGNALEFANVLADKFKLRQFQITAPLKARISESDTEYVAFVFNYTKENAEGHISGYGFDEDVYVAANDVVIIRRSK